MSTLVKFLAVTLLCCCLLLPSCSSEITDPPQTVAVSVCPNLTPGIHRITSDFGIQFDASENVFIVNAALRDMPPGRMYVVKFRDDEAHIVVWRDDNVFRDLKNAYPVFSKHIEQRTIHGKTGRSFGTDQWGYLQTGERWRYVKFSTGDAVGYEPTPPKQANLLDEVINSACFSSDQNSKKWSN